MRILPTILLSTLTLLASGCYISPVKPPAGIIYTEITHPLTTDFGDTPVGRENVRHASETISYVNVPLFFWGQDFAFGDADIDSIASRNEIEEISYAELTYLQVLGIYHESEVHIYGN